MMRLLVALIGLVTSTSCSLVSGSTLAPTPARVALVQSAAGSLLPTQRALPLHLRGGFGSAKFKQENVKERLRADLQAMDTDNSGTITIDEYVAYTKSEFERALVLLAAPKVQYD